MARNLDRRVEVGVRVRSADIHKTLCDYFEIQWRDNVKARNITSPYLNSYVERDEQNTAHRSQQELFNYFNSKNGN